MPFIKLNFKPGLNRDQTNYSNEGGWFECDKIRFLSGYPQKIGGWIRATPNFMLGVGRLGVRLHINEFFLVGAA